MGSVWKPYYGMTCSYCQHSGEVLAEVVRPNATEPETLFKDGQAVRCAAACGFTTTLRVDENGACLDVG